jgi:hypothetical protein
MGTAMQYPKTIEEPCPEHSASCSRNQIGRSLGLPARTVVTVPFRVEEFGRAHGANCASFGPSAAIRGVPFRSAATAGSRCTTAADRFGATEPGLRMSVEGLE